MYYKTQKKAVHNQPHLSSSWKAPSLDSRGRGSRRTSVPRLICVPCMVQLLSPSNSTVLLQSFTVSHSPSRYQSFTSVSLFLNHSWRSRVANLCVIRYSLYRCNHSKCRRARRKGRLMDRLADIRRAEMGRCAKTLADRETARLTPCPECTRWTNEGHLRRLPNVWGGAKMLGRQTTTTCEPTAFWNRIIL